MDFQELEKSDLIIVRNSEGNYQILELEVLPKNFISDFVY